MKIQSFYDEDTATFSYVVIDEIGKNCAIIDSALGYDMSSGRASNDPADEIIDYVTKNNLTLEWIIETHIHADHLTAASYIKDKLGGKIAIGDGIKDVIKFWAPIFNHTKDLTTEATHFDHLFKDGEKFSIGNLEVKVMHIPGHTPSCVGYLIEDAIFVGDAIFSPRIGTARTDFPGGSAGDLYDSIQKILALPDETRIFTGHDYPQKGSDPQCLFAVHEQKKNNVLISDGVTKEQYVEARNKRDFGKSVPRLLFPAIQVNICAGKLPKNIEIPLNKF